MAILDVDATAGAALVAVLGDRIKFFKTDMSGAVVNSASTSQGKLPPTLSVSLSFYCPPTQMRSK